MDCFADFCLSCDRQTNGSSFCSQACRLTEMDPLPLSEPSSPFYFDTKAVRQRSMGPIASGFQLPPAFDFSIYRSAATGAQQSISQPISTRNSVQLSALSPSTSQTSISSMQTTRSFRSRLSEEARNNLKEYAGSFDQVRTLKRKMSLH